MLPRILTAADPESYRAGFKIVRRDTMDDVPGLILSANVDTGQCLLRRVHTGDHDFSFGPDGLYIDIVRR